jgi:hypothetical protein
VTIHSRPTGRDNALVRLRRGPVLRATCLGLAGLVVAAALAGCSASSATASPTVRVAIPTPTPTAVSTPTPTAIPTPTPTAVPGVGKIVFTPSEVGCLSPVVRSYAVTLRNKTQGITESFDGTVINHWGVTDDFWAQQPDGSWLFTYTYTADQMSALCKAGGLDATGLAVLTPGTHTLTETDADGNILAKGSYTVK